MQVALLALKLKINGKIEDFCGIVMSILKFDYRTFNIHALDVKWFSEPLHRSILVNIRRHPSGILAIDSTRVWEIPQHCEKVLIFHIFLLDITLVIMSFYFFIIKFQGYLPSGY